MRSVIHWFIDNPVAANLLMLLILVSGYFGYNNLGKEAFPLSEVDTLSISASYQGASPTEVEQQVVIRLEEAIADLEGIDDINSTAREGSGVISVSVKKNYDVQRLLNNIKTRIDALTTLPDEVENIQVSERIAQRPLMSIAVYGSVAETILKDASFFLQQELLKLNAVSRVEIENARDREMIVEVSENTLRNYGLRFDDISAAIRNNSINIPAGTIKTDAGTFQVQSRGQALNADEFSNIVIVSTDEGAQIRLEEIATVKDDFADVDQEANFNGNQVMYLELFTGSPPDIVEASRSTREALESIVSQMPQGVNVEIWFDWEEIYDSRMSLLFDNTVMGLVLVFIVLMLFLRPSLAAWVCVGIATAIIGSFSLLSYFGVTLNMMSMYGFLLVLGIVVDDAIVVGESIYFHQRQGLSGKEAAKAGAQWVSRPVIFAVLSTIVFFAVLLAAEGRLGTMLIPIATVVIICLIFSIIESLFILPSHLAHAKAEVVDNNPNVFARVRLFCAGALERFANTTYVNFLNKTLSSNGNTLLVFLLIFIITMVIFTGGYVKRAFFPVIPSDRITVSAILVEGVSFENTKAIQQKIESAAYQLKNDQALQDINGENSFIRTIRSSSKDNSTTVDVTLVDAKERSVNIIQVKDRWQTLMGSLPDVKEFSVSYTLARGPSNKDISFNIGLPGNDSEQLAEVVADIRTTLNSYEVITAIEDNLEGSRTEIELRLKPYAEILGLSLADIARQIRQGFYGEEVQRIPRGSDDIKVMLRYPSADRRGVESMEQIFIRTNDGRSIPLIEVADIIEVPGYTKILRENRQRSITITADVTKGTDARGTAGLILQENKAVWESKYPGLKVNVAGAVRDEREFNSKMSQNFLLALLIVYGLMAIVFSSYWQPILILTAIPFGFVGAVFGHLFFGSPITMMSIFGFVACAGVVVNDNLVLLDRIHQLRDKGATVIESITQAGADRFRAIILTSITTFVGLLPILAETSIQAQFMIPLVLSLSFGVLFATVVTLIFVPNLYFLGERVKAKFAGEKIVALKKPIEP